MKVVLRHTISGRYYRAPGNWVRRADNALAFEDFGVAREFSRLNNILKTQPVQRLAPYLMPLLQQRSATIWHTWMRSGAADWYSHHRIRFTRN